MAIFALIALFCGLSGLYVFFRWGQDNLEASKFGASAYDDSLFLATTFLRGAVVLIIVWLFMRATGFHIGFVFSLVATISGLYYGYKADLAENETDYGDFLFKKYLLLAIGFISFMLIGLLVTG